MCGGCMGSLSSFVRYGLFSPQKFPFLARRVPAPHQVPEFSGGLSFRFAMVQDVLHERFPKHGTKFYEARNRQSLQLLDQLADDDPQRWPIIDDVAVAFDRLGYPDEAVPLLRSKLAQQQLANISVSEMYTTYANLGTLLIHANMGKARQRDAAAVERLDEGLQFIHKSIEANPNAHFGREKWQAAIVEFLRATIKDPSLLTDYDCLGNRLNLDIEQMLHREANWSNTRYGRPNFSQLTQGMGKFDEVPRFFDSETDLNDPANWEDVSKIREYVTTVGAENGWKEKLSVPSHQTPVPFDSPVLGIIGMWRQGGGANPHFALALGETMLRIGQRYIAWNAFERAELLADRYSADPEIQGFLRTHCQNRQAAIEETLRFTDTGAGRNIPWQHISLPPDSETVDRLSEAFQEELNLGLGYQAEYQQFEAAQIAAGVPIDDKNFYDKFNAEHPAIATPAGLEETLLTVPKADAYAYQRRHRNASSLLGAGLGAMLAAVLLWIKTRIRNNASQPTADGRLA